MKNKNSYFIQFAVSLGVIVLLIGIVLIQFVNGVTGTVILDSLDGNLTEKGEMFSVLDYWTEKTNDPSKYIFNIHVYNFGKVEAKNVEMLCEIYASNEEEVMIGEVPAVSIKENIGNLASTSFKGIVLEADKNPQKEGEFPAASCKIYSCENCEILLDRIQN